MTEASPRPVANDEGGLEGKRVAFTGRFASMTQVVAGLMVAALGGEAVSFPSRFTSYLVVGQESWPPNPESHLTLKLLRARELQALATGLQIISEQRFLELAGLAPAESHLRRFYTIAQLSRVLDVPGPRIRWWVRRGLIRPASARHGVDYFEFRQVAALRMVKHLVARGVAVDDIARTLERARRWLPDSEDAISVLAREETSGELVVHLPGGAVANTSGQLLLPAQVKDRPAPDLNIAPGVPQAEECFEQALRLEEANDLEGAARAYQRCLLVGGPDPEAAFNLGNVLATLGRPEEALARFREAVECQGEFVEAWNNQAGVLMDLGRWSEAVEAATRALALAPDYADAHYNLAMALAGAGRREEALAHGLEYLAHDATSAWAERLRSELGLDK